MSSASRRWPTSVSETSAADQPADADGRIQVAHARGAELQQLEGGYGDQDGEGAVHERLRREEADHEPQPAVARDRPEPGGRLVPEVRRLPL